VLTLVGLPPENVSASSIRPLLPSIWADAGLDIAILRERPGLLLIGVDPSSDELLVLSSRPHQALSVADLVEVMQRESGREKLEGDS
jgi:hypothetical protein